MAGWTFTETRTGSGRFLISATGYGPDGANVDITVIRGVPTVISSYSSADPFGDATAVLSFGGITMMDDLASIEFRRWLRHFADIDIYWSPSVPATVDTATEDRVIDPFTQAPTVQNPYAGAVKIWEGYIASFDLSDTGFEVQCQGALFQVDRYQAKPFFPARPWPVEALIADQFDHTRRPNLRTKPLQTIWPATWKRVVPVYNGDNPDVYAPVIAPGANWTEYVSRATGGWEAGLTSYIQDQLTAMITRVGDGDEVAPGDQWTVGKTAGRQPQLYVRARSRAPDFSVWLGTPGVSATLTSDSTQAGNMIFGRGTDLHGVVWNNAAISSDGTRTDYLPLAADRAVYPLTANAQLVAGAFVTEVNAQFDTGFSQEQATGLANLWLARDRDTGWTGSVTLSTDPSTELTRWQIRAGMTMVLQGFLGSGATGIRLHISAVSVTPEQGTVELTVDTRYRDLLTVQEAINRTRDPLTPVKLLLVNRASVAIPDVQAPWDYTAGAGFVPQASVAFHQAAPPSLQFPYESFAKKRPPVHYPDFYVRCNAAASADEDRWAGPIPVRTSTKGTISRTEFAVYDKYGNVLKIPFHVSIYSLDVSADDMPTTPDGQGPSPYINNAFEATDPATGQAWPALTTLPGPDSLIVGWGNQVNNVMNRAGFSPGSEADHSGPTGLLIDATTWNYDSTKNLEYDPYKPNGVPQDDQALLVWAMFYCEYTTAVFFKGRLFHQSAGSDSS